MMLSIFTFIQSSQTSHLTDLYLCYSCNYSRCGGEGVRIPPTSTKSHFPQWPFPQNMHYTINNKDHKKLIHPTEESLFYVLGAFWVFICPLHKAGVFREALSAHFLFKKNKNPILPTYHVGFLRFGFLGFLRLAPQMY